MRAVVVFGFFAWCTALLACEAGGTAPTAQVDQGVALPSTEDPPGRNGSRECGSGDCDSKQEACGAPKAGCDCGSEPARDTRVQQGLDPTTGQAMQVVGRELAGVAPVSVATLLENPDAYAGKTVRLEGDVSAMCHHKRRWFAVQDPGDRSGRYVRILAAPAFLVPPHSIGRRARTEGVVEVIEVPAATQQHFAQEHDLAASARATKRVVLRATGAEII